MRFVAEPKTPDPGWYDDPSNPSAIRWWDGELWTSHTKSRPAPPPSGRAYPGEPPVGYGTQPSLFAPSKVTIERQVGPPLADPIATMVTRAGSDVGPDAGIDPSTGLPVDPYAAIAEPASPIDPEDPRLYGTQIGGHAVPVNRRGVSVRYVLLILAVFVTFAGLFVAVGLSASLVEIEPADACGRVAAQQRLLESERERLSQDLPTESLHAAAVRFVDRAEDYVDQWHTLLGVVDGELSYIAQNETFRLMGVLDETSEPFASMRAQLVSASSPSLVRSAVSGPVPELESLLTLQSELDSLDVNCQGLWFRPELSRFIAATTLVGE